MVEQNQCVGMLGKDLARQFAADAAACAGDHDDSAGNVLGQQVRTRGHRVAPEQVFNVQLPKILHLDAPAGQILHARQRAHMDRQGFERINDGLAPLPRSARDGQQNIGDALAGNAFGHRAGGPDGHAVDAAPALGRIIIHKAYQRELARYRQGDSGLHTGRAGAKNQQTASATLARIPLAGQPKTRHGAAGRHQNQENQGLQNAQAAWHHGPLHTHQKRTQCQGIDRHRLGGGHQGGLPGVAKYRPVEPKMNKNGDRQTWRDHIHPKLQGIGQVQSI